MLNDDKFGVFSNITSIAIGCIWDAEVPLANIALPIGISFFTFQAMSYVIDLYRGQIKVQKNLLYLALYVSFFPQLIAGPIVKYRDIEVQIENRRATMAGISSGFRRFVYGLGKKVLISNLIAQAADNLYGLEVSSLTGGMAWLCALTYTLQIYYDFSGYSDMAIGLGRMFGFEFLENFNYPYISSSIREFWKRWHISLSTWFQEYLYIPLGGNRKGKLRTYVNLLIVFFATGMWHGASWNFIGWGMYHGFFSVIERLGFGKLLKRSKVLSNVYTMLVVMTVGTVICLAVPGQLMGLFTANPVTMQAGSVALRVISLGFIVSSVSVICSGALEGLGKGVHSLIISLCRYVVVIIPVAFIVSRFMGAVGVWHAFWITEAVTAVISYMVYRKGVNG